MIGGARPEKVVRCFCGTAGVRYLIDGHNLIGQIPGIDLADPDDEIRLVERLKQFTARHRCRCTVVFDGGLPGGKARSLGNSRVEVIFAHSGTNADRIILERLRQHPDGQTLTVVSNDQLIRSEAVRLKMKVLSASEFARRLNERPATPDWDDKPPDGPPSPAEIREWERLFSSRQRQNPRKDKKR